MTTGTAVSHDPVERREDDKLDRAAFASLLARALVANPERRSMVAALYGDWGSGKTSTLNLCFEALQESKSGDQPLVVRFNPWWYSNTGELLAQFFEELGGALQQQASDKNISAFKGIKEKMLSYRRLIAPAGAVADLFVSGGALTTIANMVQAGVESTTQEQQKTEKSVRQVRQEIETALEKAGRRVVIAIDDIDRLSAAEVRDMFKLVKAIADFPNTRYLLAFDFETVSEALSEVQRTDGAAYLEKIVQVPFRLPDPAPGQLMEIVKDGIDEIASRQEKISEKEQAQARERIELLAFYGLGSLWDNMRRVNRFLDSLEFTLPTVAGEVRLSDFVLLEALRVMEPKVYETVLGGKNLLVGIGPGSQTMSSTRGPKDAQQEINRATAALVDAACAATPRKELGEVFRRILEELFPRVGSATGSIGAGGGSLDRWANEKRVCVEDYFEYATRWGLTPGAISDMEVREIVSITDPTELRDRLRVYDHDDRDGVDFASALEKIGPFYRTEAGPAALETLVRVLLGEERSDRSYPIMFLLVQDSLAHGRLRDPDLKKRIFVESIEAHRVLPLMADLLADLGKEHGWFDRPEEDENYRTFPSEQFQEVVQKAVADLRNQAEDGKLLERHPIDVCIYFFRAAVGEKEPAAYFRKLIEEEGSLQVLLKALIGEKTTSQIVAREIDAEESSVVQRLRPLWVLKVDEAARDRADKLLADGASDEDAALLEWFVGAHEAANTPIN